MRLHRILILTFITTALFSYGQWNVQTGYDFGFFTNNYHDQSELLEEKEASHLLHRFNLGLEYQLKNNFLFSVNSGVDIHNIKHNLLFTLESIYSGTQMKQYNRSIHHSIIQNYKAGLSIGYLYSINTSSSIIIEVNYDQFFVNKINNKISSHIIEYYSDFETQNSELQLRDEKYTSMIDLNEIGYGNEFIVNNKLIIFSLNYRYQKGDFFINSSAGFSFRNNNLVKTATFIPKPQNLFLFGINLGYIFPQKDKNDEK